MKQFLIVWTVLAASVAVSQILPSGLGSRWWRSPQMVERLALTPDQQKKMDDVFQQSRLKLIDLTASLDKEEAILEPLVAAEQPDADKVRTQINRVADARAELEKANANMLLGFRLLLTQEQWKKLEAGATGPRARRTINGAQELSPAPKKQR
jgi:Spy/CpxP family protein refolding chaperone